MSRRKHVSLSCAGAVLAASLAASGLVHADICDWRGSTTGDGTARVTFDYFSNCDEMGAEMACFAESSDDLFRAAKFRPRKSDLGVEWKLLFPRDFRDASSAPKGTYLLWCKQSGQDAQFGYFGFKEAVRKPVDTSRDPDTPSQAPVKVTLTKLLEDAYTDPLKDKFVDIGEVWGSEPGREGVVALEVPARFEKEDGGLEFRVGRGDRLTYSRTRTEKEFGRAVRLRLYRVRGIYRGCSYVNRGWGSCSLTATK